MQQRRAAPVMAKNEYRRMNYFRSCNSLTVNKPFYKVEREK